jgi:hypothetical protein
MPSAEEIIEQGRLEHEARSRIKWWGDIVARLVVVKFEKIHERQFVEGMNRQLNQGGELPDDLSRQRIKDLAWKYRRQMPAHARPKLPPRDPIVQEMEAQK